jgi:hypothetical protein
VLDCARVTCPAIPTTCTKFVQDPKACCPTCLDTGCGVCPDIVCSAGTHSETVAGDCCASCVADPPDACGTGQKSYADLRAQLLEKYSSSGCKNSADCVLMLEDTACAYNCNIALPGIALSNFTSNLDNQATSFCGTCPAPARVSCDSQIPACVNAKCLAVDATGSGR